MSIEGNKRTVERIHLEVNDQDRYDLLEELVAEEMVIHSPVPVPLRGREGFQTLLGFFRASFPVQRTVIKALIAEGDMVASHHSHYATHGGDFLGCRRRGGRSRSMGSRSIASRMARWSSSGTTTICSGCFSSSG
jgi:predicted ester cyclase